VDFDWCGFGKDIVLVAIPTGVGAYASRYLTNSWQERTEKLRIRQESLGYFHNAISRRFTILDSFFFKINEHYSDYQILDKLPEEGKVELAFSKFPDKSEEQPRQLFGNEYSEVSKEFEQTRFDSTKLMANLKLFYKSKELEEEYQTIGRNSKHLQYNMRFLLNSTTLANFGENVKKFQEKRNELITLISSFQKKLMEEKIEIPKS